MKNNNMDLLIEKLFDVPVLKTVDKREFCLCIGAIFFFFLTRCEVKVDGSNHL